MGKLTPCILGVIALLPSVAVAAPGDLDPSFGDSGHVTTVVGSEDSSASDVLVLADGRIVVGGYSGATGARQFTLARYDADGVLDATFGTGGIVTTAIGATSQVAAILVQPDGMILAGGLADFGSGPRFALARYDSVGVLDPGFGTGGVVTTTIGSDAALRGMVLLSDGSILTAGYQTSGTRTVALVRYTSSGVGDVAFGAGGVRTTAVGTNSEASDIVQLNAGGFAVAGVSDNHILIIRYEADGDPDPAFGNGGVFIHEELDASLTAIAARSDGRVLATGWYQPYGALVVQLTADGALDPTFGGNGLLEAIGFVSYTDLLVRSDGLVLIGGFTFWPGTPSVPFPNSQFLVMRLESDGDTDPTFSGGSVQDSFDQYNGINAIARTPDGWLVAAGSSGGGGYPSPSPAYNDLTLARYDVSSCGNGESESAEDCDDDNSVNGDGCDNNCTSTGCGNGIVTSGETCDGGECCTVACSYTTAGTACTEDLNPCTDDVCDGAGTCGTNNTLPCNDGNMCTGPDECSGGACLGTPSVVCPSCQACEPFDGSCVDRPRTDCIGASRVQSARFTMIDAVDPDRSFLKWSSPRAGAFDVSLIGDPIAVDSFDICFYRDFDHEADSDAPVVWSGTLPPGGTCDGNPCWRAKGKSGFEYRDKSGSLAGITRMSIKAGPIGKLRVDAEGNQLEFPDFSDPSDLPTPLVMQVHRGLDACWGTSIYAYARAKQTDAYVRYSFLGD
jgi:uncharacterized delta-60 repeat protein